MSNKIIDYLLVISESDNYQDEYQNLVEMVNEEIAKGWQPYGNLFTNKRQKICQVMVKYEA